MEKEASYYESSEDEKVKCHLCGHNCLIEPSGRGICGVRENRDGNLYSLNYGAAVAASADPIEKKPLFHFLPSTKAFSIAAAGCNMSCDFCQNHRISRVEETIPGSDLPPEQVVSEASDRNCKTIAYTYSEPTVFFEYAYDTSRLAREEGLYNVFVTNGFMEETPLREIEPYLDGCNLDLKSFSQEFYKSITGAGLERVLENIKLINELGIWLEITTLIIPGFNDSEEELGEIAGFIADVDPSIPWHISRFRPAYRMKDRSATPIEKMRSAKRAGEEAGLEHIYMGNVPGSCEDTICPDCGQVLIERFGFRVEGNALREGKCPNCGREVAGVWS